MTQYHSMFQDDPELDDWLTTTIYVCLISFVMMLCSSFRSNISSLSLIYCLGNKKSCDNDSNNQGQKRLISSEGDLFNDAVTPHISTC